MRQILELMPSLQQLKILAWRTRAEKLLTAKADRGKSTFRVWICYWWVVLGSRWGFTHSAWVLMRLHGYEIQKEDTSPAREAGKLTGDLHLSLLTSKSNPQSHPPAWRKTTCCRLLPLSPYFNVSHRSPPCFLPHSLLYPRPQLQQAFPGTCSPPGPAEQVG